MKTPLYSFSGGGTRFAALLGAWKNLESKGYQKPERFITSGVSAGAIMALLVACNREHFAEQLLPYITQKDVLDQPLFTKRGKFNLLRLWNVIRGKNYLTSMKALKQTLINTVRYDWHHWGHVHGVKCYIMAIDPITGSRVVKDEMQMNWEDAIDHVVASCSIPGYTAPVNGLYDGGLRMHNPAGWVIDRYYNEISEVHSFYSRPSEPSRFTQGHGYSKNILTTIMRSIDIMSNEISKDDELHEVHQCEFHGIKLYQYFVDTGVENPYTFGPELYEMFERARNGDGLNVVEYNFPFNVKNLLLNRMMRNDYLT